MDEMSDIFPVIDVLIWGYLERRKYSNSIKIFLQESKCNIQPSNSNFSEKINGTNLEEVIIKFIETSNFSLPPFAIEFGQKLKQLSNEYIASMGNFSSNQKMLYGKNVQCGIKTRSAQNPPESGIVSPPNHGNESPVDFGHSAKRKPQHPVSMQQRIKTGLLGPETVEKLANAATEVVNKHDDVVEPSTLIPGFNDELEKYLGQDNFADFFANLDFDEGLYGTPGTSYQPIPSPRVQDFDIRNIPIEENRSGTNEKPISREDKILKEKSLHESGPAVTWIKTAIEKPSEAKLPQETPGRKRRNLIPYSQRPIIGYHSRPRKNTSEYPSIITNSITTISTEDPIFYPNITPKPSTSQNRERPQKPVEETAPNLIEIVEEKENLGLISLEECKIEEIMTDELMEFRKSIDKLIKSYEHMRNENIQHEAGIKSLKKLLQDKEEEIKRTRNENIQHEAEIKCLKTSLQDKEEEIKRTYTEFKRARSEKEANDASVEIMKSEIDSLRKQMKESQEVKNLKTELKEAKQELEELRAENDSLIERINVVSQALAPILIRPKTPRRGSKREHTTDSDDEDNDSKLPRRMVVINEDESTPQKSNATNQSTTSEITSIAESDQMEQERQGHKLEASISSMKLSPPAALISPLPEKFMFFQQQAMQNFDLPLQNGEKEIQSYELHDQLQMSPTHTNEESLAELVRPKSNQSAHSNGLEEGEVTTPVKVPVEKKELPKISFTIHSPTKLPTPSHLQVTKKEETAPKKPNSMKLTAAMSQIQETKTKVKDEKARLLSKIPSATTSTADVVANFLDSQGKYETKRQTDKKRPEEPSRLLHDHKKVMLKDPRDDRKLESNRRSREHDSRRSHSPETSRASSQSMNRGDRKPPPPLSKREAPSRSFKPDVKKPGHRHSVDRNLEKDKEKDKGEKNQGHGHILHIRDSGTNMHWECSPPVLTKETPKSEKTQIVEKISQTTLDAVQQGSQAFAQIQQSFALQQTIINGLDIDRDPKLFDFPGANSAKLGMKLERARKMRLALLAEMEKSNPTQPTPPTEDDSFGFAIPRNAGSPSTTSSSSESSSGSSSSSSSSGSSSDSSSSTIVKKKTVVLAVPKRGTRYAPMKSMKTMEQVFEDLRTSGSSDFTTDDDESRAHKES